MSNKPQEVGAFTSGHTWTKTDPAWIPELDDKLIARYERLKSDLKVEQSAFDDAAANSPQPDDQDLNATQMRIRDHAVHKVGMLFAFLSEQLGSALQHMAGQNDRLDFAEEAKKVGTDFDNGLAEDARLKSASDRLVRSEIALRHFAATHRRTSPANYRESLLLFWAVVLVFVVLESVLNGVILQDISPGGFAGGVLLASGISLVNVGTGVIGGAVGWRLIGHRFWLPRTIGIVVTVITLTSAVFWNFLIAHFRQLAEAAIAGADPAVFDPFAPAAGDPDLLAAEQVTQDSLFGSALTHMNEEGWFALDSMMAWLLLGLGLIVFILACREGWDDLADRYWDYRKHDVKQVDAQKAFERQCEEAIASASLRLEESIVRCRAAVQTVESKCVKSAAVADLAEQRFVEVANSEAHWIAECNHLLRYYRESNDKVRHETLPPPGYWGRYPAPNEYRSFLAQAEGGAGSRNIELATAQLEAIRRQRADLDSIIEHNRTALALFEDEVRKLKASVPERGRKLRLEAKKRARDEMSQFLHVDASTPAGESTPAAAISGAPVQAG
jgi:hypothetical protein